MSSKTKEQYLADPNVMFHIERTKNANIVVYAANLEEGKFKDDPVDVYWLDLEPSYMEAARKKGKTDDRCELSWLDKSMAYGVSVESKGDDKELSLVALPERKVSILIDNGRPIAKMAINGQMTRLKKIFVHSVENWVGLPTVKSIDIFGELDGQDIKETLKK